jgi:gluconolactonase
MEESMCIRALSAVFTLAGLITLPLTLIAGEDPSFKDVPPPTGLIGKEVELSATMVCFLEGPAVDAAGNVFFSDIAGNRILKKLTTGKVVVFSADSGRTNGNAFDAQGRLISCEGAEQGPGGRRQIVRHDLKSGKTEVLTSKYNGKRYNSPNDVCVDEKGRIWFTDPFYGPDRSHLEMDEESLYRIDPDGKVTRVLSQPNIHRPNGVAVSPDNKTLYLVDSHPKEGGNRKIWAFDIADDGGLKNQRLVFNFGKGRGGDGLKVDMEGNLWVAAGIYKKRGTSETLDVPTGVYVITPKGKLLGRIPIPEDLITNVAFGGPQRKTLYVTAGRTLYSMPVTVSGYSVYPPLP